MVNSNKQHRATCVTQSYYTPCDKKDIKIAILHHEQKESELIRRICIVENNLNDLIKKQNENKAWNNHVLSIIISAIVSGLISFVFKLLFN